MKHYTAIISVRYNYITNKVNTFTYKCINHATTTTNGLDYN